MHLLLALLLILAQANRTTVEYWLPIFIYIDTSMMVIFLLKTGFQYPPSPW